MSTRDNNNNGESGDELQDNSFENDRYFTKENVEDELAKMKIICDYDSDGYEREKVCLTNTGIDLRALRAGTDVEFSIDEENQRLKDEEDDDPALEYEKIFHLRNMDMIGCSDDIDETDSKTPFQVLMQKMVDISPNKNGGVMKRVLTPGMGQLVPMGAQVRIHYNAYFEMTAEPFDSTYLRNKAFEFKLGANTVVLGMEIGIATMKQSEKSQFIFSPDFYVGRRGCEPRVPRETSVMFEIEVISCMEIGVLDEFQVSSEEERSKIPFHRIIQICDCLRQLGNDFYTQLNFGEAAKKYRKAIYFLENRSAQNDDEDKKISGILKKLYLNVSQCFLKLSKPKKSIYYCKLVLMNDENNVKALYRYGKALRVLQDFDRSKSYLLKALKLEPNNSEIVKEMDKLNDMVKKYKALEGNMYKRMFNNGDSTQKSEPLAESNSKLFDDETKAFIKKRLSDFKNNDDMKTFKISYETYPKEMVDFIIQQTRNMGLVTRIIQGGTKVLHVMKN